MASMDYLLDTNVLCEITAKRPEPGVVRWIEAHASRCCLSGVSLGEIWKGIHRLPEGKRKRRLADWAEGIEEDFRDRILGLDTEAMKTWGKLYAKHEARGFNLDVMDSLLAALAIVHNLTLATRNTSDFPSDVPTTNPWVP